MINSFKYAFHGLIYALKERTFRILLIIAFFVITLSFILEISLIEWSIVFLTIIIVLSLELLNTQVERTLDILQPKTDLRVRVIKDVSAAAVLIASIGSAIIGIIIFLPYIIQISRFRYI